MDDTTTQKLPASAIARRLSRAGIACALALGTACSQAPAKVAEAPPPAEVSTRDVKAPPPPLASAPSGAPQSFAPLVESVKAAVVNVDVKSRARNAVAQDGSGMDPFDRFFNPRGTPRQGPVQQGAGSGFIIDPTGLVLTNNHVVEGAVAIRVRLGDGRSFDARILGRDPLTDLALLRLQDVKDELPTVRLGDSDGMKVGDWVLAIGNPFGLASSVSAGIISARARDIHSGPYDDFLQTDAAINPGNSGGPLFNLAGEVIGINTAIIGGGTGIGFAVPSTMAKALLPQLEKGTVRRGWLGVSAQDVGPDMAKALGLSRSEGALVADVAEDAPAASSGLKSEDVVVAVDGTPVGSAKDLTQRIGLMQPGTKVALTVVRDGKEREVKVELGERPDFEGVGLQAPTEMEESPSLAASLGLTLQDAGARRGFDPRSAWGERQQVAEARGALIADVAPGSAAEHAGLQPGMVVIGVGDKRVSSSRELGAILTRAESGSTLLLRVRVQDTTLLRALRIP